MFKLAESFFRDRLSSIDNRLSQISAKLDRLEDGTHGARAVNIGNGKILLKIVVDGANIALMVESDDKLIMPWLAVTGKYEVSVTNYFLRNIKADSHTIDVGSNFGYFACLCARFSPRGKVLAIEADERIQILCRDNLTINGFGNIGTSIHAAANADGAPLTLNRRVGRSANTSIIPYDRAFTDGMGEPPSEPFEVKGVRLDDLLPRMDGRVDFLKIDVEGAEPLVFQGAQELVATNPGIRIVMEWSPGQIQAAGFDVPAFVGSIAHMGLRTFMIEQDRERPISTEALLATDYAAGILLAR